MNEQDIINLILGEPEDDFHGTVPSKDKRLRFDRLRGHAGALMHYTHGNLDIQEPSETRRSACLTLDVPLPVVVLNEYVRKHFPCLWSSATAYRCPMQAAGCASSVRSADCGRNEGGTWLAGNVLHLRPSGVI